MYAAKQQSMDRPVAIKVLKPRAARLESSQEAFVSEAIITGGLDHPNIMPIYDVGKQPNDAIFYAMKQVVGVEWKERIATNTVSENLDILLRVCDAIAFAHARGIIHRDLKPANIMLGPFGEVLVMDWGLAMPTEDHPRRETFPAARAEVRLTTWLRRWLKALMASIVAAMFICWGRFCLRSSLANRRTH